MALALASCQKAEFSEPVSDDFQLNVTVADLGSGDDATKAMIKTLWTEGDRIFIWYDTNKTDNPDLAIAYDGATWNKTTKNVNLTNNNPSEGDDKYIKALYNGQVIATSKDSYIFKNNTLTFSINNWTFLSEIQVVVTGITGEATDYTLACDKFYPFNSTSIYTVDASTITAVAGTRGAAEQGFESKANPGCATFVFATADYTTGDATDSYTFTLKKAGERKAYTPEAKSFLKDSTSIKGIKMAESSFGYDYLCFTAEEDECQITITAYYGYHPGNTFQYSTDGYTWTDVTLGKEFPKDALSEGQKVYVKATSDRTAGPNPESTGWLQIGSTANFAVSGNLMYLVDSEGGDSYTTLNDYEFAALFMGCTTLVDASGLSLPSEISASCYYSTFAACTALRAAPALPAKTLKQGCYYGTFMACKALRAAPALPAKTLAASCYASMFSFCTALTTAPALPATDLKKGCYTSMFDECSALTTAPALPATTLAQNCYDSMFHGCSSLTTAPVLPADTLKGACYKAMFLDCLNLKAVTCLATDGFEVGAALTDWLKYTADDDNGILTIDSRAREKWIQLPDLEGNYPSNWTLFGVGTAAVSNTASRTDDECGWVQLWADGPKFAEFNVGATISSYGSLSSTADEGGTWESGTSENIKKLYCTANVGGLYPWHNSALNARIATWGSDVTTGTKDVATALWGNKWKEPTSSELTDLSAGVSISGTVTGGTSFTGTSTVWTWCDGQTGSGHLQYISNCTLKGWKISGKGDYASNSIFLPVTGYYEYYDKKIFDASTCGVYWSSDTYNDGGEGYNMGFESSGPVVAVGCYQYGYSVRAVLKEN